MLKSKDLKELPDTPGVYLFKNSNSKIIYIGKAKNLKNRVSSYFGVNLEPKTQKMINEAASLSYIKVNSDFESILLEAKLVRKFMPKYNIQLKDDKSPLYIGITKDKYPRILTFRRSDIKKYKLEIKNLYGPFIQSVVAKGILRVTRKIFPYTEHLPQKKTCIYRELGLCNPCPSEIELEQDRELKFKLRQKYLKNIQKIKKLLSGNLTKLNILLNKEMKKLSSEEKFEEAGIIKNQINMLEYLTISRTLPDVYLGNPNFIEDLREKEKKELASLIKPYIDTQKLNRIECFDIAHFAGASTTGSMVTFINGEPEKKLYRHFKVRKAKKGDDISAMKEILKRRVGNFDNWGKPDLIIIDGGKPQLGAAIDIINSKVPVISLAKKFETIIVKSDNKFIEIKVPKGAGLNLLQRIRDEAHRFARRLHHKHIENTLFSGNLKK
jgi:excinuclease ABC subunit C